MSEVKLVHRHPLRRMPVDPDHVFGNGKNGNQQEPDGRGTYREFAPPDHLRELVVCFWRREVGSSLSQALVMPDGCVDIVWVNDLPPFVVGPMTLPVRVEIDPGTEIVGVRFRPGVAHHLFGVSARELLNQDVPLPALWSRADAVPWEEAMAGETLEAKLEAIDTLITSRQRATGAGDPLVRRAAQWIANHPLGRIAELSQLGGMSERHLRRRFHLAVGYGPKQLQRIMRLQFLLWLASRDRGSHLNLARLATIAGYTDQPHMTREVRALTGVSPVQLLFGARPASAIADLFQTRAAS